MRASIIRPHLKLELSYLRCRQAVSQKNRRYSTTGWPLRAQLHGISGCHKLDAVIILGGGLDESQPDSLPPWVKARLKTGARVFSERGDQGTMVLCLGGGTPHKPAIVESSGQVLHEATACARFLIERKKIPPHAILKEVSSYDTVGNGYFAATIHALPADWRNITVVTSSFHMPRTKNIFNKCFELAGQTRAEAFSLSFEEASDEGTMPPEVLHVRAEKEHKALKDWESDSAKLTSLRKLHSWLYSTHLCYSVSRQAELINKKAGAGENQALLASY